MILKTWTSSNPCISAIYGPILLKFELNVLWTFALWCMEIATLKKCPLRAKKTTLRASSRLQLQSEMTLYLCLLMAGDCNSKKWQNLCKSLRSPRYARRAPLWIIQIQIDQAKQKQNYQNTFSSTMWYLSAIRLTSLLQTFNDITKVSLIN